ncbi:peptidoglycan editing factor PgeF [Pseudoteredinibacter isoporae]|uniref:Purine nucleoside phosphorylase n=1 Tax=Pseudoteredinibacter isoporae TaxID=570281 RepID=A0A7X0JTV1_9GAMM|nr:peptidoglycan editing factor PgeF [Pseudoteredinibacter isoporae]MBB6521335.1 hypothetical protein [Pseudoteredinibacter isoporae]NHO86890.1 peptidoglycan editing factor PgeF [Pseudoteredinibacter isoporae]NIB24658.1 peptidoglycan editing factor PgeF [Pseudoteredinibacter isoporae]
MASAFAYQPDIPLPDNIAVMVSRRDGGQSSGPYGSFNIADHVGDEPDSVSANRELLLAEMTGAEQIQWLTQTHSCQMIKAGESQSPNADACYTEEAGLACAVMTADCLPVLLWKEDGSAVAAVHAGWRGLANGILSENFPELRRLGSTDSPWQAYIGPAISQAHFEVGVEVLETFFEVATTPELLEATVAASEPSKLNPLKYHLNLAAIARAQLLDLGVTAVFGGDECSFEDSDHYFSYRRASKAGDVRCGRMASLIWRKQN